MDEFQAQMLAEIATIKADQSHLKEQMANVIQLLDRMVKVEEKQTALRSKLGAMEIHCAEQDKQIANLQKESDHWRAVRRVTMWVTGIIATLAGALHLTGGHPPNG